MAERKEKKKKSEKDAMFLSIISFQSEGQDFFENLNTRKKADRGFFSQRKHKSEDIFSVYSKNGKSKPFSLFLINKSSF